MSKERRDYYRVSDDVLIQSTVLDGPLSTEDPYSTEFTIPDELTLMMQLTSEDQEYEGMSHRLTSDHQIKNPERIDRLERKIQHIYEFIAFQLVKHVQFDKQHISLSENGMSLNSPKMLTTGTFLHVILMLPRTLTSFAVFATIRHRRETKVGGGYQYGLQFVHMREIDRQRMSKHIIHKQSLDIHALRTGRSENS